MNQWRQVMGWNSEEFTNLCITRGLPDTKTYQEALFFKAWVAKEFGSKAIDEWVLLFSTSLDETSDGNEDWVKTKRYSEAYAQAALQAAHSLADITAQIINKVILDGCLGDARVTIYTVKSQLERRGIRNILNAIKSLIDSSEYRYINGFVNT